MGLLYGWVTKSFGKQSTNLLKVNILRRNGIRRSLLQYLISNPVYDADGDIIGAVIIIIDITEISKREQLRREFTSNVSHELKTPLTSISGFAGL